MEMVIEDLRWVAKAEETECKDVCILAGLPLAARHIHIAQRNDSIGNLQAATGESVRKRMTACNLEGDRNVFTTR
jgi:hypothetical protein